MRLRFLGTGTSFGIPVVGCTCAVCTSPDPRDRRTRHAALLTGEAAGVELGGYLLGALVHAVGWSVLLLAAATLIFRRRDFL